VGDSRLIAGGRRRDRIDGNRNLGNDDGLGGVVERDAGIDAARVGRVAGGNLYRTGACRRLDVSGRSMGRARHGALRAGNIRIRFHGKHLRGYGAALAIGRARGLRRRPLGRAMTGNTAPSAVVNMPA
jgi:hypothetical protein